ncbi:conjugative transposon protein TraM [Sphingobacterium rhinopitheci]|uniref:conjugative transposon protein TraM n=1 Tax=Sphingobacterium rhinopitheci TaxID=2781960 RepID=UPI001F516A35|nr:conjugative transposon protein TraM [Sphingobacterium rhinopitheci]MCI0922431.1 conjugative transposon protein TraM [Sphingobacterium rhinopitheci]
MNVNFNKPRYVIPLILLPFLCIFFYVYKQSFGKQEDPQAGKDSLQTELADVSEQVRNRSLSDKLDAYRNQYKQADGYTAIGHIQEEQLLNESPNTLYNQQERQMLDSINRAMKGQYANRSTTFPDAIAKSPPLRNDPHEEALQRAISEMNSLHQPRTTAYQTKQPDAIELFRQQMELIDSMGKANDPEYKEDQQKRIAKEQRIEQEQLPRLNVRKTKTIDAVFNTVKPEIVESFITAIVDQDIKGYAGSRLRIRLLDDMLAGKFLVKKGTYIYAEIIGFTGQRVNLSVSSIMKGQQILPVKLAVYDHDGLPGLYVPASAFREFSKELGSNASQGMTLQQAAENNSQLVMSMVQKMFQSTTSAINKMIRQNKAKIKYNTLVYLIDPEQLRADQKNY